MYFSDLNITLFGMGIWGVKIAQRLISLGVELDVVDSDPTREIAALEIGARTFSSEMQVAPQAHGVIVATPSTTHFALLKELIPRRLPIFVEKPLTVDVGQAQELRRFTSAPIFVMHTWLYHPGINAIADVREHGELGELLYLRTSRTSWTSPRKDTDTVWNLLPHDLTIARAILGHYPAPTFAIAEVHDRIARGMTCILGNRPFVVTEISNRYRERGREVRAHFKDGIAVLKDEKTPYLQTYRGDHRSELSEISFEKIPLSLEPDPLHLQLLDFLRFLKGGSTPLSTLADGIAVVELISEIRNLAELPG